MGKKPRPIIGGIFGTRTEVDSEGNVKQKDEFHLRIYWDFWRPEIQKVMKGNTCRVFLFIAMHMNREKKCWPSQETIAKRLFLSRNTVSKCVDTLVKAGLIDFYQERDAEGKFGDICYRLKTPLLEEDDEPPFPNEEEPPVEKEENHSEEEGEERGADAQKLSNGDGLDGKPVDKSDPSRKKCARQTPSVAQKVSGGENPQKSRVSADAQKVSGGENPQKSRVSTVAQKVSTKEDYVLDNRYLYREIDGDIDIQQQQEEGEQVVVVDKLTKQDSSFIRQQWEALFGKTLTKNRLDQLVKAAADNWDINIMPPTSAGITTRILVVMENIRRYSKPHSPFAMVLRALREGWTWDQPEEPEERRQMWEPGLQVPAPRRTNFTPYNWVEEERKRAEKLREAAK